MPDYASRIALNGFWRGLKNDLCFAQECANEGRIWNLKHNLRDIRVASEYLELNK